MEFTHNTNQIAVYNQDYVVIAEVTFPAVEDNIVNVDHTYVNDVLQGQGIAGKLMNELVSDLRSTGRKATLTCSYAVNWFKKHPECADVLVR